MKKAIATLATILTMNSVQAEEISLVAHGVSKHIVNHNFNERNYGAGLRYEVDDYGLQIGGYRNSINKNSFYAGIDWNAFQYKSDNCLKFEAGPFYGVVTGYKYDVNPVIGLQVATKCDNVFVRVRISPDPYYGSKAFGAVEIGLVIKKF